MELCRIFSKLRPTFTLSTRGYSIYNPHFVSPVYREEDQEKLIETGAIASYKHKNIKAARSDETSSVFHDIVIAKLVNYIMQDGRKEVARANLSKAFEQIKKIQLERYHKAETPEEKANIITDPLRLLKMAIKNSRPILKLSPIRRGGQTYQVPMPISDAESIFQAMRWLVQISREKEGPTPHYVKLAYEIMEAAENRGRVVKRKTDLHKTCEANKAYAHYRWT